MSNELPEEDFEALIERVAQTGKMDEASVRKILTCVYADGIITLAEADMLFDVNETLQGVDEAWKARFAGCIKDFVLQNHEPTGWVSEEEAEWLLSRTSNEGGTVTDVDLDMLLAIVRYAEGAPPRFGREILKAACGRLTDAGRALKEDIERVRTALYAMAGDGATWVTGFEADILFRTNDAIAFAKNDPAWNDLFARAVANHLMARAHPNPVTEAEALSRQNWLRDTSVNPFGLFSGMLDGFGTDTWFEKITYDTEKATNARLAAKAAADRQASRVDEAESSWFMERLGWDKKISPAERALVNFLKEEVPGFADGLAAVA